MLHHVFDPRPIFEECYRILRKDGYLYSDHDVNYYFGRFYHVLYQVKYRNKPGYDSEIEEIAEYHNTQSSGLNPIELKNALCEIGFREVEVKFMQTSNPSLGCFQKAALKVLKIVSKLCPLKSFFTHFSLIAKK